MLAALAFGQANGVVGAWAADSLRQLLGPQATAQVESWYLSVVDAAQRTQYQLSGQHPSPPWRVGQTPTPGSQPPKTKPGAATGPVAMSLSPIAPILHPPLAGEGIWTTVGLPPPWPGQPPLVAKTFLRPDPARPYAVVTLLQFDMHYARLHLVAGTEQPGGPLGKYGTGSIPTADQQGNQLIAALNGGFKYADGRYGMMVDGAVYVPPRPGAATIAVTKQGQVLLGAWGIDPGLTSSNTDLVAWRQNAALLIDHGALNPLARDDWAWGGTVLNRAYTWRSGIGITASGTLLYAAGDAVSAATLGHALRAAGAVMAMQTDINPYWVRAFLYERDLNGQWQITKLHSGMQGAGEEYLRHSQRDFFYLTRVPLPRQHRPPGA
ncbi:MAG: phosphodiester glycosidase family protein [Ktedonobacterales bacterium]